MIECVLGHVPHVGDAVQLKVAVLLAFFDNGGDVSLRNPLLVATGETGWIVNPAIVRVAVQGDQLKVLHDSSFVAQTCASLTDAELAQ